MLKRDEWCHCWRCRRAIRVVDRVLVGVEFLCRVCAERERKEEK